MSALKTWTCGWAMLLCVGCTATESMQDADVATDTSEQETSPFPDVLADDVDPRIMVDGYEYLSEGGFIDFCWRYELGLDPDGLPIGHVNGHLAASNDHIYFIGQANREGEPRRSYLHALDANGRLVWRVRYDYLGDYLPLVVDDEGSIYVMSNLFDEYRHYFKTEIIKVTSDGHEIWRRAPASGPPKASDRPGFRGGYAALDHDNNLYVGHGSQIVSIDPQGELRWWDDPDPADPGKECDWDHGSGWYSMVQADRVWFASSYCGLHVYRLDGTKVFTLGELGGAPILPYGDGIVTWRYDLRDIYRIGPDGAASIIHDHFDRTTNVPLLVDPEGHVYGFGQEGFMKTDGDRVLWTKQPGSPLLSNRAWFDASSRLGFHNGDFRFFVLDTNDGAEIFAKSPGVIVDGDTMVMLRDGQVVFMATNVDVLTGSSTPFIDCFKVPLGLPDPRGWVMPHGDMRNTRRTQVRAPR